ncbi:unnamed protein product [Dibothriocephalus latus]|uniref:Uncharacterized protein n=1 Tax=Dibothriocephalus latus TaxID=60516 RepID=A0A3P7L6U5_DIBLA|nr:unnamed protein product [Dibothriocephalus latus]
MDNGGTFDIVEERGGFTRELGAVVLVKFGYQKVGSACFIAEYLVANLGHLLRQRATKIAILVTRTAGALICVISAGMLKHFTKAYYVYQHKPANLLLELWSYSKDRATWIGSFGIGLGLGITASSGLSVCNRLGKNLHLAGLIGQMFLPAVAGYISERMFYKNASQTLGRTSLILSVLLFFSLVVDLVLRLIRHFSWWKNFTDFFRFMPVKKPAAKVTASAKKRFSSANVGSLEAPAGGQQSEPAGPSLREVNFSSPSSAARRPTLQVTVASHPGSD